MDQTPPTSPSRWRPHGHRPVRLILLLLISILLYWQFRVGMGSAALPVDDFVEYWAAAKLQIEGKNPYSPDELLAVQRGVGWKESSPVMMWNPPWTLTVVLPFGVFGYSQARQFWLFLNLGILFFCVILNSRIYEDVTSRFWLVWVSVLVFFPFLFVLRTGQISALVLLGITAFLFFERRGDYGWAAVVVCLTTIKPHLLYLFWIALLLWTFESRRWRILWAGATTLCIGLFVPLVFGREVLAQYWQATTSHPPLDWATPTLGGILRIWMGVEHAWLQFVPAIAGSLWLAFYYRRHHSTWKWSEQMPLLLLVSVSSASYGAWTYDQVVLLPALIVSLQRSSHFENKRSRTVLWGLFVVANFVAFVMNLHGVNEVWFFWMAPTWLGLYWVASTQSVSGSEAKNKLIERLDPVEGA